MADDLPLIANPTFEDSDAEDARLTAEAEAEIAAGRFVSNNLVSEWLSRVGTSEETPMPREWLK